jgi:hypothetical protein
MSISKEIIEVIDALAEKFGIAIDWTSQNVLPYIKELCGKWCIYEAYTSIAWIAIFCIVLVIFTISTPILHSKVKNNKHGYDLDFGVTWAAIISWACLIISMIVCLIGIPTQVMDIIECKVFPEKFIIEQITKMIETH